MKPNKKEAKAEFWSAVGKLFPNRSRRFSFKTRRLSKNELGRITVKHRKLEVAVDLAKHKRVEDVRSTLLHELSHAVLDFGLKPKAYAAKKEKITLEELDEPFTDLYAMRLGRKLKRDFALRYPKKVMLKIIERNAADAKALVKRTYTLYNL